MALAVLDGDGHLLIFAVTLPQVDHLDACAAQQVNTVVHAVILAEHHAPDAGLDDEFAALHAGRGGDIQGRAVAAVVAARHLGDGVGLGMQDIGLGMVGVFLTHVLKPSRCTVIAIACNTNFRPRSASSAGIWSQAPTVFSRVRPFISILIDKISHFFAINTSSIVFSQINRH